MNLPTVTPAASRGRAPNRRRFLGASETGAVMGLSPWRTPLDVWMEKTGRAKPVAPSPERARILARGHKLEPYIVDMAIDKLREQGHEVQLIAKNRRFADALLPFLACEIDAELRVDGQVINLDAKSVTGFAAHHWGDEGTDEIPLHYAAQFMQGLGITARPRCIAAALVGLDDVKLYQIERDDETIAAIRGRLDVFWRDHVLTHEAPPVQRIADVRALWPDDNGRSRAATPDIAEAARELRATKLRILKLEAEHVALALRVAEYMGPAEVLTVEGQAAFTHRSGERKTLDEAALRRQYPDIFVWFEKTTTTRTLRVKNYWRG